VGTPWPHGGLLRLLAEAAAHQRACAWSEAALCYAQIADQASGEARAQALLAAADCLRRDDRLAPAARMLRDARADATGTRAVQALLLLAAVLHQTGQLAVARDLATEAAGLARDSATRRAVLDTLLGTLSALGDLSAADACLEQLRGLGGPSVAFHDAARARLRGDLREAAAQYRAAVAQVQATPGAAGAVAAAQMSLAEVALLDGQPALAAERYAQAGTHWAAARRRSGVYRSEAGQLRAALCAGEVPLPRALDDRIDFARARQLALLESHLRIVRAGARHRAGQPGAAEDLQAAVSLAGDARFLEGRARLGLRTLGLPVDHAHLRTCLDGDAVWGAVLAGQRPMVW